MMREQMRDKAKSGDLKVVAGSEPKQKIGEKKKRRWDQAAGGGDDTPAKKKASTWDQAEVGTPSNVSMGSKARFHVEVSTRIGIRNTQILHCALR